MRTALENERLEASPGESKPREHACGAESDYNRAQFARALYLRGVKSTFFTVSTPEPQRLRIAFSSPSTSTSTLYTKKMLSFCANRPLFRHSQCAYSVFVKAKSFTRRAPEIVFVRSQRKLYLIYFKHTFSPLNRFCRALPCEQTRSPRPLEIEAAAAAVNIEKLPGAEKSGHFLRLKCFAVELIYIDSAARDLRI